MDVGFDFALHIRRFHGLDSFHPQTGQEFLMSIMIDRE